MINNQTGGAKITPIFLKTTPFKRKFIMQKRDVPSKQNLISLYNVPGTTINSLAKHFGTSQPTVRKWLIDYNIQRKDHKQASQEANRRHIKNLPTPDILHDIKNLSIDKIEEKYNIGQQTIYTLLEQHNVSNDFKHKQSNTKKLKRDHIFDQVFYLYNKHKNIAIVAAALDKSYSFIRNILHENSVEIFPSRISQGHQQLIDFCVEQGIVYKINDRSVINPYELDLVIENKIAIEYCGLYWHSQYWGGKDRNYHLNKLNAVEAKGMRLFTVFEHYNLDIIKSMILVALGKANIAYARKTECRKIISTEALAFEKENHLMGARPAKHYYGLFDNNQLIQTMSFGQSRFTSKYQYEMIRNCVKKNTIVVGGTNKLIQYFIRTQQPLSMVSYCDRTYGTGRGYATSPFNFSHTSSPNYWYFNKNNLEVCSRLQFQKHKLENQCLVYDQTKSEYENMLANGWDRYWDCGNHVFTYTSKSS